MRGVVLKFLPELPHEDSQVLSVFGVGGAVSVHTSSLKPPAKPRLKQSASSCATSRVLLSVARTTSRTQSSSLVPYST